MEGGSTTAADSISSHSSHATASRKHASQHKPTTSIWSSPQGGISATVPPDHANFSRTAPGVYQYSVPAAPPAHTAPSAAAAPISFQSEGYYGNLKRPKVSSSHSATYTDRTVPEFISEEPSAIRHGVAENYKSAYYVKSAPPRLDPTEVRVRRQSARANLPTVTPERGGMELYSAYTYTIRPRECAILKTDISIELYPNVQGRIFPKVDLELSNHLDVFPVALPASYEEGVEVSVCNYTGKTVIIRQGDMIALMIFQKIDCPIVIEVPMMAPRQY